MTEHRLSPSFSKQFEGKHVSKSAARGCLIRLSGRRRLEVGAVLRGMNYVQNRPLAVIEYAQNAIKTVVIFASICLNHRPVATEYQSHETANQSKKEYPRGEVTTNTIAGCFSTLKRGLIGTFHNVGEQHLQRYCNEFDFRCNTHTSFGYNDVERTEIALKGISGKRLTYQRIGGGQQAV